MSTRTDVLARVAAMVPWPQRGGGCVRVGVDGVDGVGKTTLADELAEAVRSLGRPVVRVGIDGFHHDRATRYRRGRNSPEGFWLDSYDYQAFRGDVLRPFGPDGDRRYRTAAHDVATDTPLDLPWHSAPAGTVLVVDGLFLHREELVDEWDLGLFLDAPFEVTVARLAARDGSHPDPHHPSNARYVQGQRLYLRACRPQRRAHLVIDHTDLAHPVLRPGGRPPGATTTGDGERGTVMGDAEPPQPVPEDVAELIGSLTRALRADLGPVLQALYLHGSLVAGDFAPQRSDVDLLVVLTREPDDALLQRLGVVHAAVDVAHPAWLGRVEVEYVSLATMQRHASEQPGGQGVIARVSPGEHLHLLPATSHRILTWSSVRDGGQPLLGPAPRALLPVFDDHAVRAAVLDHVRDWPVWVRDMTSVGGQAYAVLTLCRAVVLLEQGRQVSKKAAATLAAAADPARADLVLWARDWWYGGGDDRVQAPTRQVQQFVDATSARLLTR